MSPFTLDLALLLAATAAGSYPPPQPAGGAAVAIIAPAEPLLHANWPAAAPVQLASAWQDSPLNTPPERLPALDLIEPSHPLESPFAGGQGQYPDEFPGEPLRADLWADIWQDHVHYYSWETLGPTLVMFGAGATIANTPVDQQFRNWWQRDVHTAGLHDVALGFRNLGEGLYVIPASVGIWLAGEMLGDMPGGPMLAQWGGRTTRSIGVGFPMLLLTQLATGGSRPIEGDELAHPSHWKFFGDNNGVSGHAFIGAIPFLTAAQLTDSPWAKGTFLAGSTLVAMSRLETDSHYLSQVMLGWWMAYIATSAVERTTLAHSPYTVEPLLFQDGFGLGVGWRR
jgi:hypothetical protein